MGRRSVNTLVAWGLDFLIWFPKDLAIRPVREWVCEWSLTELPFWKLLRHGRSGNDVPFVVGMGPLLDSFIMVSTLMKHCAAFRGKRSSSSVTDYIYVLGREHQQSAHQ